MPFSSSIYCSSDQRPSPNVESKYIWISAAMEASFGLNNTRCISGWSERRDFPPLQNGAWLAPFDSKDAIR